MTPLLSLLHPSARPHKWREIHDAWIGACDHPENVEYVLCADERWGFPGRDLAYTREFLKPLGSFKVVWNTRRRCYVDAVNTAAEASTGRILIVIADDQYPCEHWDTKLINSLGLHNGRQVRPVYGNEKPAPEVSEEFVISVSTGTPKEHERCIMMMPILSRARYQRLGYVFWPEYESVYADNDFYAHARKDGVIIDARNLMFPHQHPLAEPGAWDKRSNGEWINRDEAYAAQNRKEAYLLGEKIFDERFRSAFGSEPVHVSKYREFGSPESPRPARGSLALALPGESFSHVWVAKLLETVLMLLKEGWSYCPLLIHTSEPGITRATIVNALREMKEKEGFDPQYIVWMDDDQIVEPQQILMLIQDAEQFPDVDMFAGWTWIASPGAHVNAPQVSCGRMDLEKGEVSHAEYRSVQSANGVFEVGWTGFPLVLMRTSALDKVGKHPFSHFPCEKSQWGECGEDISFCKRLTDAGGKIYVDSRVFVPHLKLRALGPVPASKEEIALALTGAAAAD